MSIPADWQTADGSIRLYRGDCLDIMPQLSETVDCICTDLPYGTTDCKWDTVIPFAPLWEAYKRAIKPNGVMALFADEPFTSALIISQVKNFKHRLTWDKDIAGGFLNAHKMPLKQTEDICIFAYVPNGRFTYNPIFQAKREERVRLPGNRKARKSSTFSAGNGQLSPDYDPYRAFPSNLIRISARQAECNSQRRVHPTQKPVALLEYLIKTYTNEGETVLDSCFGSGTAAVACINTGRRFIGIERDAHYFDVAVSRIEAALGNVGLFADTAGLIPLS